MANPTMTVAEAIKMRQDLEQSIQKLVQEFSDVTLLEVEYVRLAAIQTIGGVPIYQVKVDIKL